jgi:hypothetical protein
MDLVFACDSIWTWDAEKEFARLKAENPDLVQAAHAGLAVTDPETGLVSSRRPSRATVGSHTKTTKKERVDSTDEIYKSAELK